MNNLLSFLDNRFVLCIGCGGVTSLLLWFGKMDSTAYAAIIIATVGAYVSGATIERAKEINAAVDTNKQVAP